MPRKATLRNKGGYWASDAGGRTRRFGKVGEVSHKDAMRAFRIALAEDEASPTPSPPPAPKFTVDDLAALFLEWVKANRAAKSHEERTRHLARFRREFGSRGASTITGKDLESFLAKLAGGGMSPDYLHKHAVSVRAMFNQGSRKGWLPSGFSPFKGVDRVKLPPRAIGEGELPLPEEIAKLLEAAARYRDRNMVDLIRLHHATGARPKELIDAKVGDFQRVTGQIVLAAHKRAGSLRNAVPRTIYLNADALAIITPRCAGRPSGERIFVRGVDKPYRTLDVTHRFQRIRDRAKVREELSLYSFRHLYISELLMAGVDALLVSRMAGTSVLMLEKCYAHFRTQSFRDAQARLDAARSAKP